MDNSSDKLRRVLNELAILNQPDRKNGTMSYGLSQLKQIKSLCSEAYILSDLCVSESSRQFIESEPAEEKVQVPIQEEIQETKESLPVKEEEVVETPPTPVESVEPEQKKPVDIENSDKRNEASRGSFSKGVSMTRRFEYINKLFKGDSESYAKFVSNLEESNLTETLIAYENTYNQLDWSRKQESADEFKRLIIKYYED